MTETIRKSIAVPISATEAFDLFTTGIDDWWPKESHSLAAEAGQGTRTRIHVEAREGGRIIEVQPDGEVSKWGTVTAWDPGHRFEMDWHVGRDPAEATRVEVVFTQTEAGTRVDLTHSGFAVHGKRAVEMCANYNTGWNHVFGSCFAGACTKHAA